MAPVRQQSKQSQVTPSSSSKRKVKSPIVYPNPNPKSGQSQITSSSSKSKNKHKSPIISPNPNRNSRQSRITSSSSISLSKLKPPTNFPNPIPNSNSIKKNPKQQKSLSIVPSKPVPASTSSYEQEVVDRRIRVYRPFDEQWYEGFVAQYDGSRKRHLVKFDNGDEESLDLGEEKIEWISSEPVSPSTPSYGQDVVYRRIKVYRPLDSAWHEGFVTQYDGGQKKHLVKYDNGDSESLDLGKEKIEWTPSYAQEFVDRRIRVYWPFENEWHEGFVAQYDGSCKKHFVKYDDGAEESLDLGEEKIERTPSYAQEVVDRRITVYRPLDNAWHEGFVMQYDGGQKKHLVKYDNGDNQWLDLGKEKIEWTSSYAQEVVDRRIKVYWPFEDKWHEGFIVQYDGSLKEHLVKYDDGAEESLDLREEKIERTPSYAQEVVDRRIRVYRPLHNAWHEGFVTQYDGGQKNHLVKYDNGDSEWLDLGKKKIEWTPSYAQEVVDRKIRVYWPFEDEWHEGFVAQYDGSSKKHLVKYDDGGEESLDLGEEKMEWTSSEPVPSSTPSYGQEVVHMRTRVYRPRDNALHVVGRRIRVYRPLDNAWHEGFVTQYDGSQKKHLVKYDNGDSELLDLGKEKIEWTPSYGQEVVDRRIRVYWPFEDLWHEGFVAQYDGSCKKHLVKYDDGVEESLDLGEEKIEWISSKPVPPPTPLYGQKVVYRRIRVYWPLDKAWHEGLVEQYDGSRKKHVVKYDDGDSESLDLGKEKFEWTPSYGQEVVDRRIRVYWPLDNSWYEGFVAQYVESRKKHLVKYDDGDNELLDLEEEKIEWTPSYGEEVIGRRIRVYWPLDKAWHEGFVMQYDGGRMKHLVKYDDGGEEILDLRKKKLEWISSKPVPPSTPSCGQEVVGRRIRVYWPLDNTWHEGFVPHYEGGHKKLLVKYDDGGDYESLDLRKEKIEWISSRPVPLHTPLYEQEVVGQRIRVYWPLDNTWHGGVVMQYDGNRKKLLVKYDDGGDEELLDLRKEKIEWISSKPVPLSTPSYGQEVVGRRIRVYWPLDKAWHEGFVARYDGSRKKLLVIYNDGGDEELLDLRKEKIDWIEDSAVAKKKKFERLRSGGGMAVVDGIVLEKCNVNVFDNKEDGSGDDNSCGGDDDDDGVHDDSVDEDLGNNLEEETTEVVDVDMDVDLDDKEKEEDEKVRNKEKYGKKVVSRKRNVVVLEGVSPRKKSKSGIQGNNRVRVRLP